MQAALAIPVFPGVWLPHAPANPDAALALLFLGIIGVYAEFSAPGLIFPGAIGSIFALFGLAALSSFPIDWRGGALIVLAFVLFVLEAKYITYGVLTGAGALAMLVGLLMLIANPEHRIHLATAVAITIPFALISSFLFSLAVRARRNKVVTGIDQMVGLTGSAVSELNPGGTVMVRGEYWNALAAGRIAAAGKVRVTSVNGLTLRVEPLQKETDPS